MGRTHTSIAAAVAVGIILSIFMIGPAFSAEAQVFATVDVEKAFNDYQKKQELEHAHVRAPSRDSGQSPAPRGS